MSPALNPVDPDLSLESTLAASGAQFVAGMDEVGRGALAGPVSVGLVVLDMTAVDPTSIVELWNGVRDSKALTAVRRKSLAPTITASAAAAAVGHTQAWEIDRMGLSAALRLAGLRALAAAEASGAPVDALILDGSYNWLRGQAGIDDELEESSVPRIVQTLVKADRTSLLVAAASIVAKVERDALMEGHAVDYPDYAWHSNKGYGSAAHRTAIAASGVSPLHRTSWNLGI